MDRITVYFWIALIWIAILSLLISTYAALFLGRKLKPHLCTARALYVEAASVGGLFHHLPLARPPR